MKNESGYPNREFLQLAQVYEGHAIGGWFVSEKLDGVRCFWDGGSTRGLPVEEVPFANIAKQHIKLDQHYSTGLWSRYGHPYQAPDWFLDQLPAIPLDGELYIGPKKFEDTISIVRAHNSGDRWRAIQYRVFETLCIDEVFKPGMINNPNFSKVIDGSVAQWVKNRCEGLGVKLLDKRQFTSQIKLMELLVPQNMCVAIHAQEQLNRKESLAKEQINDLLSKTLANDGEGLIVRDPMANWIPKRCKHILKLKDKLDSEGIVVGYISGLGKYLGMLGSLSVQWNGKTFNLSGFDDRERVLDKISSTWAVDNPDKQMPENFNNKTFPLGSSVTFDYASLTQLGYPKEARYKRKWVEGIKP